MATPVGYGIVAKDVRACECVCLVPLFYCSICHTLRAIT